jgi:hypothetical protein
MNRCIIVAIFLILLATSYLIGSTKIASANEESVFGTIYLMKPNSTAHIIVKYTAIPNDNAIMNINDTVYAENLQTTYPASKTYVTMTSNESSVRVNTTTIVQYSLTVYNHTKGLYWIPISDCTMMPIVVGNISEVNPSFLFKLFTEVHCSSIIQKSWSSFVGLDIQDVTIDLKPVREITLGIHSGGAAICSDGFVVVIRSDNNHSFVCVKSSTAEKLVARGWGYEPPTN